ncbi:MAG: DUF3256 family protein [Tannerellaceae bacterium]|jgi:hypothetical protein|nr:DUF3256 family protein [Tannerellaceae bacterium]
MKRYSLLLLFCICALGIKAQDMKTLFTNMPDSYLPQLETAWRKDLIDLFLAGKEARLQNTMTGYSRLLKLTDDYLLLQVTERSAVEMKRLPLINHTYIICMIVTVEGPVADSRVAFYTTEWQALESSNLFTPVAADWFIAENADRDSDACKDALARLDMDLIKYELSSDAQTLTAVYTTPLYLSEQERKKILPFLKDVPKVYTWDKSSFR